MLEGLEYILGGIGIRTHLQVEEEEER